jgi:hypothetical protein
MTEETRNIIVIPDLKSLPRHLVSRGHKAFHVMPDLIRHPVPLVMKNHSGFRPFDKLMILSLSKDFRRNDGRDPVYIVMPDLPALVRLAVK